MRNEIVVPDYGVLVTPRWVIKDTRLSAEARFLWLAMHGFGGTWQFRKAHLQKLCGVGSTKFERMTRELIELGFLTIETLRGEGGRVTGSRYVLNQHPALPQQQEDGTWEGDDDGSDVEYTTSQTIEFEAMRAAREAAAISIGSTVRKVTRAANKAAKAARAGVSGDEKTAKTPANHRDLENRGVGENEGHRDPENPGLGKPASLDKQKDYKKTPISPADSAPASEVAEDAGEGGAVSAEIDHDQLARQWAGAVSRRAAYAKAHVRPETAQAMLRLGLTTEENLRRTGIRF